MGKTLTVALLEDRLAARVSGDIAHAETVTLYVYGQNFTMPDGTYPVKLVHDDTALAEGTVTVASGIGSGTMDLDTVACDNAFVSPYTRSVLAYLNIRDATETHVYCQQGVTVHVNDAHDLGSPLPGGVLHNLAATAAPAVTDDAADGYGVGSMWINVTADTAYVCVDASTGAAVWNRIDGSGGGVDWPTADGSALTDANRFAVGQEAGGVWTWIAKTGTQLKAWLKTYFDTLYQAGASGTALPTGGSIVTGQVFRLTAADATAKAAPGIYMHDGTGWICLRCIVPYTWGNMGATPTLALIAGCDYILTADQNWTAAVTMSRPGVCNWTKAGEFAAGTPTMSGRTVKARTADGWTDAGAALCEGCFRDDGTYLWISAVEGA